VLLITLLGVLIPTQASGSTSFGMFGWLLYAPVWQYMRRHRLVLVHASTAVSSAPLKWRMQQGRPAGPAGTCSVHQFAA
jgi:hypothetical protein